MVTCSVGNKCYMNNAFGENYYDFIAQELPEFICGNFPVSRRVEDTYIAGLSMGGYGALAHGLGRPAAWCAVGAFSPGTDLGARKDNMGHELPPMMDLYAELENRLAEGAALPELFLCCGQEDFLYESVVRFRNTLLKKGVKHRWDDVPGFEHEWKFWDIELEQFLDWIPRTDAYANLPRHKL